MKLSRLEKETIILFNEAEDYAEVYTFNGKLQKQLARLAGQYPEQFILKSKDQWGAVTYIVPKKRICVNAPKPGNRIQTKRISAEFEREDENIGSVYQFTM